MKFLKFFIEPWLVGKAHSRIRRKKYKEAIEFLKKVIALINDGNPGTELHFFDIGYCHLKLNEFDEALSWFSKSYDKYKYGKANLNTRAYYDLLSSYSYVLKKHELIEQADKIDREANEVLGHLQKK